VKLGAVLIAVTVISTVFSMVSLPAVLMLMGPGPEPFHERLFAECSRRVRRHLGERRGGRLLD